MRVIEPHKSSKKSSKLPKIIIIGLLIIVLASSTFLFFSRNKKANVAVSSESTSVVVSNHAVLSDTQSTSNYTPEQYKEAYNAMAFPNTKEFLQLPSITGYDQIDKLIMSLAEKRGYKLRSIAREPIAKTSTNDYLQEKAVKSWEEMRLAAFKYGINLKILAGFRTFDEQKKLFLDGLNSNGFSVNLSALAMSEIIDKTLQRYAPPGFSRHHTGYTIDIACPDNSGVVFERSVCFSWLSKNNYENSKKFGWIPSYPKNVTLQGPEPEAWEYVWIGT